MSKFTIAFALALIVSASTSAQVNINKSINLSSSGADAKISGIDDVTQPKDAVSAEVVQKGMLTYGGTSTYNAGNNRYDISISPAISAFTAGMMLSFKADAANAAGLTKVKTGSITADIKKISADLSAGDITTGQFVTIMFDGVNFQLLAGSVPAGSSNYVQNKTGDGVLATGQSANFDITGNGEMNGNLIVGGNLGVGTPSPAAALDVVAPNTGLGQGNPGGLAFQVEDGLGRIALAAYGNIDGSSFPDAVGSAIKVRNQSGTGRSITTTGNVAFGGGGYFMGNVGIGASGTPAQRLEITGGTARISALVSGANGALIRSNTSGDLSITNFNGTGTDVLTGSGSFAGITSLVSDDWTLSGGNLTTNNTSANVGIGTTSPESKLDVAYSGATSLKFNVSGISPFLVNTITTTGASTVRKDLSQIFFGVASSDISNYQSYLAFYTTPSAGTKAERMRIDPDGKVGIGTVAPTVALEVHHQILVKGNNGAGTEYADWPYSSLSVRRSDDYVLNGITAASFGYRNDPVYFTDNSVPNIRLYDPSQAANAATSGVNTQMHISSPGPLMLQTSGGKVSIGADHNNPPQANLDVTGTVKVFGARSTMALGTTYGPATSDGFVHVYGRIDGAAGLMTMQVNADFTAAPTTVVGKGYSYNNGATYLGYVQIAAPVRKGEYYRILCNGGTTCGGSVFVGDALYYFMPLGH